MSLLFKEGKLQKRKGDVVELGTYKHQYQQLDNLRR